MKLDCGGRFWACGMTFLASLLLVVGCSSDQPGTYSGGEIDSGVGVDVGPGGDAGVDVGSGREVGVDAGDDVDGGVEPDVVVPVEEGLRMRGGLVPAGDMLISESFTMSGGLLGPVSVEVSRSSSFVLEHGGAVSESKP